MIKYPWVIRYDKQTGEPMSMYPWLDSNVVPKGVLLTSDHDVVKSSLVKIFGDENRCGIQGCDNLAMYAHVTGSQMTAYIGCHEHKQEGDELLYDPELMDMRYD